MVSNPVTPSDSGVPPLKEDHLLSLCTKISKEEANLFIDLVGGPDNLSCIGTVASNLKALLPGITVMDSTVGEQLGVLANLSDQLLALPEEQKNQIPDFDGSILSKLRTMYGVIGSHPLYAMLARKAPAGNSRHLAAQAAVTLSVYLIYRYCESKPMEKAKYKSRIDGGCRLLRSVVEEDFGLFPELTDLDTYFTQLAVAEDTGHSLYPLHLLVRAASKEEIPVLRSSTKRVELSHHARTLTIEMEQEGEKPTILVAHEVSAITIEEEQSAVDAGCAPDEIIAAARYFECLQEDTSKIPGMQEKNPPPAAQYVRAKRQRDHVIKAAQHLPKRWQRLQAKDREVLFKQIAELSQKGTQEIAQSLTCAELALFLSVVYWLSTPMDRALNLRIVPHERDLPASCGVDEMYYVQQGRFWCLPVISPKLDRTRAEKIQASGQARPLAKRLLLPDVFNLSFFLGSPNKIGKIFRQPEEIYSKAIKTWLRDIKTEENSRLSLARIETDLFWSITEATGDIAEAVMVFARPHVDAGTFLHYTALSEAKLRETYLRVCQSLLPVYGRAVGAPAKKDADLVKLPAAKGHVGSPMCPEETAVKSLVLRLKGRLSEAKTQVRSAQFVRDVHNHMIVYTTTMLGAATGYRAVRDPLYRIDHFSVPLRRAIISDKSDDKDHGTRIAILPALVCNQLQAYLAHLAALLPHLALLNPKTHSKLKQLLAGKPPEESMPFLFLLNDQLDVVGMREKTLRPYMKKAGYKLPGNTNRHYLRTKGREEDLTAEDLAHVLGHWMAGLEPYGKFATGGIDEAEDRIMPFLEKILDESGWTIAQGLG